MVSRYAYEYDNMDRISKETLTDSAGETVRTYEYNARGELIKAVEKAPEGEAVWEYAYDPFGNRILEKHTGIDSKETTKTYEYDGSDRLTRELLNGLPSVTYEYDEDGNLTRKKGGGETAEYTYSGSNQLLTTTVNGKLMESNTYDGNGLKAFSLIRQEFPYSSSGSLEEKLEKEVQRKKVWTAAGGVSTGTPAASVTRYEMVTNAPSVTNLLEMGYQIGGSIAVPVQGVPVAVGVECNLIPKSDGSNEFYGGGTLSYGLSVSGGGEFHVEWGTTNGIFDSEQQSIQLNVFALEEKLFERIMEW